MANKIGDRHPMSVFIRNLKKKNSYPKLSHLLIKIWKVTQLRDIEELFEPTL